ncbi:glycosyltransferase family 4 protein [Gillisia xinjiangensis]|uniref:glycosyltransferase family 4 protein n=1 Tax=Gillisia xinjiangensis TaxID=3384765 RepID=UPI003919AAA6
MNQIVMAIKMGYGVRILTGELTDISVNANFKLFEEYKLSEKIIIEDYKIPQQKSTRIFNAAWLLIKNVSLLPHFIKYYKQSDKKGLLPLYEFFFYKDFRKFDTIHIQFGTNKHPVDIMKKTGYLKSRIIVSFHGHDLYFPINNRIPNNGYYDRLFEAADYLVANTAFLKEKLLALSAPEKKIEIIPVAVDTSIFKPGKPDNNKSGITRILSVGRLEIFKGHHLGIECISKLVKRGYDLQYSIVGSGSQDEVLEQLIQKSGLTNHIKLLGSKSQSDISRLLPTQEIFLMTSITDPNYGVESQGLVTAEAQACGLPVVAFDSGGVRYTLIDGETGFLCKEKDLDCFTEKIEILISNDVLRKNMGLNAVEFIERKYSENSVLDKWRNIYV